MTNLRIAATTAADVLILGAIVLLAARAIGRVNDPPSIEEWAAIACSATSDPLTDETWEELRSRFAAALAGLAGTAPIGTEQFSIALSLGTRSLTGELDLLSQRDPGGDLETLLADVQRVAESEPRGPSGDAVFAGLYSAIRYRDALALEAAPSLSAEARTALEAIPGCAERWAS